MTYIWKKFQSWNASEASQKNLGSTFAPWPTFEKCSKVEMRAKRAKKIFGVTFSFDPMTYIYLVLQLYRFWSPKNFWGHFSVWPHDLHSTYYAVIWILGENWRKKFFGHAHFFCRWPWPWMEPSSSISNVVHPFRYRRIDLYSCQRVTQHWKRDILL